MLSDVPSSQIRRTPAAPQRAPALDAPVPEAQMEREGKEAARPEAGTACRSCGAAIAELAWQTVVGSADGGWDGATAFEESYAGGGLSASRSCLVSARPVPGLELTLAGHGGLDGLPTSDQDQPQGR
jgi:hypothetical protein